ncbi:uncharacterized protein LACBIDRAFT_333096 [Laccaria bicolor S238N-H82]|uniref:Predicted protein n=1 Tax=Laccaria bicolor (strain S238N-H82 / ATCC MYA-4686) TaxID=486041 RepID=B0DUV2_LACBS|nr:uncharacterized protein LACBIDRAFT_333096 [Laccaria bicolor S238N-H82]EDR01608.1 predicted protein [Laccaria bicolor S238N-H82]|eukprot:XP_001887684.1 predicted protein [Laccaria bicolor S238N-H82]
MTAFSLASLISLLYHANTSHRTTSSFRSISTAPQKKLVVRHSKSTAAYHHPPDSLGAMLWWGVHFHGGFSQIRDVSADIDCDQGTSGAENDHILTSETRKCGVPEWTDLLFLPLRFVPLPFVYMVKSVEPFSCPPVMSAINVVLIYPVCSPHLQPPVYIKLISLSMPTTTFSQRNLFSISISSSAYLTSILTGSNKRCTLS